MQKNIEINAYAKLNLSLDIKGKREDGYHIMEMIMQSISLHDTVKMRISSQGISLCGEDSEGIVWDENNLAYKAAQAFYKAMHLPPSVEINVKKRIPSGAGMAGGSADAAAVLFGLNKLYGECFSAEELAKIGVTLGADVPFCLVGGTKLARGIGEILEDLPQMPKCSIVVAKPNEGISTSECFNNYNNNATTKRPNLSELIEGLREENITKMKNTANVFEEHCGIEKIKIYIDALLEHGAEFAMLTGTGSAVFGVFLAEETAKIAECEMRKIADFVSVVRPIGHGVSVME